MSDSPRFRRLAENERLIQQINETAELVALDEAGGEEDGAEAEVEFYCACGRRACYETILLTAAEYEEIHRTSNRFIVVPGHETPEIEVVVERHNSFNVVAKRSDYAA
jgi:hypothetical protein